MRSGKLVGYKEEISMHRITFFSRIVAPLIFFAVASAGAIAQAWPSKPIRVYRPDRERVAKLIKQYKWTME